MDEQSHFHRSGQDPDFYQIGKTQPPKHRKGLVTLVLMITIFLGGILSVLAAVGVLDLRQLDPNTNRTNTASVSFNSQDPTEPAASDGSVTREEAADAQDGLYLQPAPAAVENIPQEGGLSLQDIYETVIDSVVSIGCVTDSGNASGTGVVLRADGYLVTNYHVVAGATAIAASFTDGRQLSARVVGLDQTSDLAVLQVDAQDLKPAVFGDSSALRVGDLAVAIGDPLGMTLRGTMTDGIISAINRDITTGGRTMTLLQTNAALNSGNSGGPLINCYGQVIGINTMKIGDYMSNAGVEGIGFAIPSVTVKEIVDQLIAQGYVTGRPDLGISGQDISSLYRYLYDLPQGVYITYVDAESDAYAQGVRPGDVLVALDDARVSSTQALQTLLYGYSAGDTVQAVIYRNGRNYAVTLTLAQAGQT